MSVENSGSRIETAFANLDATMISSTGIRDVLIKKLFDAATAFNFDIYKNSPESRESFMSVINGLEGLLKGKEKTALDNVKLSLVQRAESDNHSSAAAITQLLHMINPGLITKTQNVIDVTKASEVIEAEFTSTGDQISDGETEHIESIV